MNEQTKYCNWTFWEVIRRSHKWGIRRDCDTTPLVQQEKHGLYDFDDRVTIILSRSGGRNWDAYKASLEPRHSINHPPSASSKCPGCGKYINGVNPYDDGETWRK